MAPFDPKAFEVKLKDLRSDEDKWTAAAGVMKAAKSTAASLQDAGSKLGYLGKSSGETGAYMDVCILYVNLAEQASGVFDDVAAGLKRVTAAYDATEEKNDKFIRRVWK
ncbi:hypothetical protein GCM10027589_25300 [Actinocorallia lasiicapitis]